MTRVAINPKHIIAFTALTLILFSPFCKKEASKRAGEKTADVEGVEVDAQKISNLTGFSFRILKTEAISYMPLHKFYWVSFQERVGNQEVEQLASAIIKETITNNPNTFHSFTIHIFWEDELTESLEKSPCFATATSLTESVWLKIERLPIDDYKDYRLTCTSHEKF